VLSDRLRQQLRDEGFCVVPDAMSSGQLAAAREALDQAVERTREAGTAHDSRIDPNVNNVRVYNLPAHDPLFLDMLRWPAAREVVEDVVGPAFLVSNFTANIALPGSGSMNVHSDLATVVPEPWAAPWSINIIWCLDDVHADNGATLYLPGSHHFRTHDEVPADAVARMVPFEAPAGSFIAMEGRLWHTSGANVTADEQRRLLFAYYSMDFIRPQMNWEAILSPETKDSVDADMRTLLALGPVANTRIGGALTRMQKA
jgi:ectoine hydroxylase-related dioxygenase (phytanoyl-CoA dioxygenase family)